MLAPAGPSIDSGLTARISILSRRQIEAWEPRILPGVLASQPGVSLFDDLDTPFDLNASNRGFTAGRSVGLPAGISRFPDGFRQSEADAREVNSDLLPMGHVKRVELLSGTVPLPGPSSLDGAIHLITDRYVELGRGARGAGAYGPSRRLRSVRQNCWCWIRGAGATDPGTARRRASERPASHPEPAAQANSSFGQNPLERTGAGPACQPEGAQCIRTSGPRHSD